MRGSDYLLQENKIKAFFNPCNRKIVHVIVHVIAKYLNPVNRAEFNPGVENAPFNRPLRLVV